MTRDAGPLQQLPPTADQNGIRATYSGSTMPRTPYPLASNVPTANFPDGAGNIDPYHSYSDMFTGEGIIQTNKEFIWAMESSNVTNYTHHSFPVKFGGWGSMSVPQRVIDCYLMADGRTIHNSSAEYPYEPDFSRLTGESKN